MKLYSKGMNNSERKYVSRQALQSGNAFNEMQDHQEMEQGEMSL